MYADHRKSDKFICLRLIRLQRQQTFRKSTRDIKIIKSFESKTLCESIFDNVHIYRAVSELREAEGAGHRVGTYCFFRFYSKLEPVNKSYQKSQISNVRKILQTTVEIKRKGKVI